MSHFIEKCECGIVLNQCRCMSKSKTELVVRPCRHVSGVATVQSKCCYIADSRIACEQEADWKIVYGNTPDSYTEACSAHVGEMLTDAPVQTVYRIAACGVAPSWAPDRTCILPKNHVPEGEHDLGHGVYWFVPDRAASL